MPCRAPRRDRSDATGQTPRPNQETGLGNGPPPWIGEPSRIPACRHPGQRTACRASRRVLVPARERAARRLSVALHGPARQWRASAPRPAAGGAARRARRLARRELRADARECTRDRRGPARPRPERRAAARDPVRQQHRAPANGTGRDVGGHPLCAGLARLFADLGRFRQAAPRVRAAHAGPGVRRRPRGLCGRPRRGLAARRRAGRRGARRGRRHAVCGAARHAPARRRCGARTGGWRHDREISVHLRLDASAESGADHAPDAVRQSADAARNLSAVRYRAAGAGRLAAVEPHVRRQP